MSTSPSVIRSGRIMRHLLPAGLVVAIAAPGGVVVADPSTPQLSPLHRQREDAQRLTGEQRGLDREHVAEPPSALPEPPTPTSTRPNQVARGAGFVLLGVAGLSAAIPLPLFTLDAGMPGDAGTRSIANGLLITSAIAGTIGVVLLVSNRSVTVAPTVSPRAAGVAIIGRM